MRGSGALERAGPRGPGWIGAQLLLGWREGPLRRTELGSTGEGAAGAVQGWGSLKRKVCAEQLSFATGCTGDSGSGGLFSVRGLLMRSWREGVSGDGAGSGGEAIELWD